MKIEKVFGNERPSYCFSSARVAVHYNLSAYLYIFCKITQKLADTQTRHAFRQFNLIFFNRERVTFTDITVIAGNSICLLTQKRIME